MSEITAKTEPASLWKQSRRLQDFLQAAVGHFRSGEDTEGIESLLNAEEELESLVESDQHSQQPQIDLNRLLPAVRQLCFYMQNQDITGIADLLEDTFLPVNKGWLKGDGGA